MLVFLEQQNFINFLILLVFHLINNQIFNILINWNLNGLFHAFMIVIIYILSNLFKVLNIHFELINHNIIIQLCFIVEVIFKVSCNNFIKIINLN